MKGSNNMLSINSSPTSVMAFKGKPSAKAMKNAYRLVDKMNNGTMLSNALAGKSAAERIEMFFSGKLQHILKLFGGK